MQIPQEKTNRNYKDSVFVDFLCRFSQKIEKKNRLHEWQMSTQCVRMEYFRQEIPKANVNINARTPHSLDVFLRKHFVRLHCKLTHSSCYRFVFDSIFPAEIFHSCTTYIHRVCKPTLDIAMLIDGKIVILIEHQSTINKNMPFRFLEYIARIYEKITTKDEKFGRKLVKLPVPEFYVFYNGKDDYPTESIMKLSDAFMQLNDSELKNQLESTNYPLEISVKVVNINDFLCRFSQRIEKKNRLHE